MRRDVKNMEKLIYISPLQGLVKSQEQEDIKLLFEAYKDLVPEGNGTIDGTPLANLVEINNTLFDFFFNCLQVNCGPLSTLSRLIRFEESNSIVLCMSKEEYVEYLQSFKKALDDELKKFKGTFTDLLRQEKVTKLLLADIPS